ncbi:hypothetical protein GQX74_014382 [Glossina fuscipes]|nr:hypothetical protein GQX74_014382 [Glossina fuscipes]
MDIVYIYDYYTHIVDGEDFAKQPLILKLTPPVFYFRLQVPTRNSSFQFFQSYIDFFRTVTRHYTCSKLCLNISAYIEVLISVYFNLSMGVRERQVAVTALNKIIARISVFSECHKYTCVPTSVFIELNGIDFSQTIPFIEEGFGGETINLVEECLTSIEVKRLSEVCEKCCLSSPKFDLVSINCQLWSQFRSSTSKDIRSKVRLQRN